MRLTVTRRALLPALAIALTCAGCASQTHQPEIAAARAEVLEIHRASSAPAFAVAVVRGDRIVWQEAFGLSDVEGNREASTRSLFRIGSVTKLFTAVALARLADRGTVRLSDPVAQYVPEFEQPDVTLAHLARHLSGVRHYSRAEYVSTRSYARVSDSLDKFINDAPLARPGEKYVYSSYGYNLLGAALEHASGASFPELLSREVFQPFAMRETFASPAAAAAGRIVTFYDKDKDGAVSRSTNVDLSDRLPSGGYLSTAADLARFLRGVFDLSPQLRNELFQPGQTNDG